MTVRRAYWVRWFGADVMGDAGWYIDSVTYDRPGACPRQGTVFGPYRTKADAARAADAKRDHDRADWVKDGPAYGGK